MVFLAHAFPRSAGDLTGGFLLRLATALKAEGIEVVAVAPAAQGLARSEEHTSDLQSPVLIAYAVFCL